MSNAIEVLRRQGVHIDIVAAADEIAKDCPKWADFLNRLKCRAQENINAANKVLNSN